MPAHVTYDPATEMFVAKIAYADRQITATCGFRWHLGRRRWETPDPKVAKALPFPKDRLADARMRAVIEAFEAEIAASEAVASDFYVPAPAGLEYLPYQKAGIQYASARRHCVIADEPGLGKGHPHWFRVCSPAGLRPIGDLRIGDPVIGSDGRPTTVTGIFERGVLPVVRVRLNDGTSVPCDEDHLWKVRALPRGRRRWEVLETREIARRLAAGETFEIPLLSDPAQVAAPALRTDPAILGVYLADPSVFAAPPTDVEPEDLLKAPASARMRFLWTYLTTRGRFSEDGRIRVVIHESHLDRRLADIVPELVRSIGGLVFDDTLKGNRYARQSFDVYLPPRLARKVFALYRPVRNPRRYMKAMPYSVPPRTIVAVDPVGREPVRCIQVAALDRLYVTEGHVVTHNTVQAIGVANLNPAIRRVLVLCPASLKVNWYREFSKWQTNGLSVGVAGTKPVSYKDPESGKRKTRMQKHWPDTDVVVLNYDQVAKFLDEVHGEEWDLLVADEAVESALVVEIC